MLKASESVSFNKTFNQEKLLNNSSTGGRAISQQKPTAAEKYPQWYLQLERRVLMIFHEKRGEKQSFLMTLPGV